MKVDGTFISIVLNWQKGHVSTSIICNTCLLHIVIDKNTTFMICIFSSHTHLIEIL